MTTLAIIWYSRTGGSQQLAEAARKAAEEAGGVDIRFLRAEDAGPQDLLEADGYLFACPENLAAIAGVMKAFFDRTYYEVLGRIEGRPYAAIICAGSDGENAKAQLERICQGWRLKRVADTPIVNVGAQTKDEILADKTIGEAELEQARELGATLAAGLEIGVF
ncbi:flavodoxin family protein [Aurantiacibacter poecillastricola]|uniref:flavodoxin family protein n=1 Tax=Aurantiacibacter poecillastricola TaxID=3064385 RepID=UPI00273F3664|nr:NAD(P)H-dependent oxidoreductase [Aurantiacibacter sp. 219JJ12-13]MDP5262995.1 NAD(P)H-dependent oxidoreductase [Aurantiacibacter sp. 219JJ12-13]